MEEYKEYDEQGKIICQVCGKSFSIISPSHLQRKHNITFEEYKNKYPGVAVTSKQFNTSRKYETTDMFTEKKPVVEEEIKDEPVQETPITIEKPDEDPIFEELENQTPVNVKPKKLDKQAMTRFKILEELQKYYTHIKPNYMIQKFSNGNRLDYEYITDYADPTLKVVVDFPKMFWHNKDVYPDLLKKQRLQKDGWKIIEIKKNFASKEVIKKALKK